MCKLTDGRLVHVDSGDGFEFYVTDDDRYNQEHYEKLGEVHNFRIVSCTLSNT